MKPKALKLSRNVETRWISMLNPIKRSWQIFLKIGEDGDGHGHEFSSYK